MTTCDPRNFPDDPQGVMAHAGRYQGGRALLVLGGESGAVWEKVRERVQPDVLLGANGVCYQIDDLDYWLLAENMSRAYSYSIDPEKPPDVRKRQAEFLKLITYRHNAKVKLLSHWSWWLLDELGLEKDGYISIRRQGYDADEFPEDFSFREYGRGYLSGWILKHRSAGAGVRVGTVGLQLLHQAAILGVSEIHTIGYDLMFKSERKHHWYAHPLYEPDAFRTSSAFIEREYSYGPHRWDRVKIKTQWFWVETMEFLRDCVLPRLKREGITWTDHSRGLLWHEGLECATKS